MTQDEVYLTKCESACRTILAMREDMPLERIVVYGSLARAELGMTSDIDIMLVLDADGVEVPKWRKWFNMRTPVEFTDEFPYVDVRFARKAIYDAPDDSAFGKFMQNCRKDGICVWPKK